MTDDLYYDISVKRLATAAEFSEMDGLLLSCETNPLSEAELIAMRADCRAQGDNPTAISATVEDNGENGDGLSVSFFPCVPRSNPEQPIFSIGFTPAQATVFCEAIMAAVRLRAAERS